MNLIALSCTKCGTPLAFAGSLICKCSACGTPHALVGSDDLLHSVSFVPYVQRTDGKMDVSLKLKLVNKITKETTLVVHDPNKHISSCLGLRQVDGMKKIHRDRYVDGDIDYPFYVAKTWLEKREVECKEVHPFFSFGGRKTEIKEFPDGEDFCNIKVVPVEMQDQGVKLLAGYRINIGVF